MNKFKGFLIAFGLVIVFSIVGYVIDNDQGCSKAVYILILLSTIWMVIDSKKINIKQYKSVIAMGPVAMFFCGMGLWGLCFPLYLGAKLSIKDGTLPKK